MAQVFVPREVAPGERRVAAAPDSVARLAGAGMSVAVEAGAGARAGFSDAAYAQAGAQVLEEAAEGCSSADVVAVVQPPPPERVARLRAGAVMVGLLAPHRHLEVVRALGEAKATALAMELIPRVSRAQRMDALSSQASIAGYRAVILASYQLEKVFPLFMTAAGTIRPATVVVLGAGVAGLQAIATARRLGAQVRANDIRAAAQGEVESLGAEFITIEADEEAEAEGGYAAQVGEDFLTRQRRVLGEHLAQAHAVITTAFVPGKPAPTLVTAEMVEGMQPGSVLVDLAAAEGGNCALTDADRAVEHHGVRVLGAPNLASDMAGEASRFYARNVAELLGLLVTDGAVRVDTSDEIVAAALVVRDGEVVHGPTSELLAQEARP